MENNKLPYRQVKLGKVIFRLFYKTENINLYYKWHTDDENRVVWCIPIGKWEFQFDNELPFTINFLTKISVTKHKHHRLINNGKYLFCIILEN